jgi:signal transduction histidine kinase
MLFDNERLEIKASRHIHMRDLQLHFLAEQGVLNETLKNGEYRLLNEPAKDPELCRMSSMDEQKVAFCLPLMRGINAYGIMFFAHQQADFFTPDRIEILQMVSNQAVIAIQNARLYQDLAIEKERIIQTQEEAQKRLARDLHDGPTQSVSAIAMRIAIARKILENSPREADAELVRIEDLARRTTQEIRHMLFTLRPLVLETEGLVPALCTMADKMRDLYQQTVVVDADPLVVARLDSSCQTVVFYLAEEAVNNARKHAEASEIRVRIKHPTNENSIAMLEVIDNGLGFDVHSVLGSYERRGSMGMVNLRERTDLVNGQMKIDSVAGKGTRIRVFIPLSEEAADRLHRGRQN